MAAERLLSRGRNPRNEASVKPGLAHDPARRAHRTALHDRDPAELQLHVQPDRPPQRPHLVLLPVVDIAGQARANDNDGYAL
jgi:hypothetical protein